MSQVKYFPIMSVVLLFGAILLVIEACKIILR
jgi:hypothetical protein